MLLRKASLQVIEQIRELITQMGDYYAKSPKHANSSVGKHVRHILDHFDVLQSAEASGTVNYNIRSRDSLAEVSQINALERLDMIVNWLVTSELHDVSVMVESEISLTDYANFTISGSLHREFCYVINHSIHHIAYAKLLAAQFNIKLSAAIGIAPATATHIRTKACAQ